MGIEKMELWECDLCGTREYKGGTKNPPWIKITIEDDFEERSFSEKIICWHCCQKIKNAMDKKST